MYRSAERGDMPRAIPATGRNWVSRTRRFVSQRAVVTPEHCDLCGKPIAEEHAHLLDRGPRKLLCACSECLLLLENNERFPRVAPAARRLADFRLDEAEWRGLGIPIDLAFLLRSSAAEGPVAVYPGPAGAVEALLSAEAWARLAGRNPVLDDLEPDVEAVLVNRTGMAQDGYRVSIDHCYALIGLMRRHWRGLSGGTEAWDAIHGYFAALNGDGATSAARMGHD
jgi:hypothetical protein